jgi:hypothetical protein
MNEVTWTTQSLSQALNSRMDQGEFSAPGQTLDFIMPMEITEDVLRDWQEFYEANKSNPLIVEQEFFNLYRSITHSL